MRHRRSTRAFALVAAAAAAVSAIAFTSPASAEDPAPPAAPGRTGAPDSVAVIGDSISTATGTGPLGAEVPANSWSTGTNATVNSTYLRLLQLNPAAAGRNFTLATNGRRMVHMVPQAQAMEPDVQYVQVQLGGNDLCRATVAEMTPVEEYRAQFRAGLDAIAATAPEALISVSSVPDIYNLWFIRYAPTSFNGGQSNQATQARAYVNLSIIPCLSLLANPASVSEADLARRLEVRQRNIEFNEVLAEECAQVLRCRYDGGATFAFSSNRDGDPIDGPLLPRSEWGFTDLDISRNTKLFCPFTGLTPGCGDHFHPSLAGLAKLAEVSWDASYDFTDTTAPELASAIDPAPNAAGWNNTDVTVTLSADDEEGVRGIEYRVHDTSGGVGPWSAALGDQAEVDVTAEGISYVEFRALDVNGNQSDSELVIVRIDETSPTIDLTVPGDGELVLLNSTVLAEYECADALSGLATCEGDVATGDAIDTGVVGSTTFTVAASDVAGNTASVTHTYGVRYAFSGFGAPLAADGRVVRGNATLPVKFVLSDADGVAQPDASVEVFLVSPHGVEQPAQRTGRGGNLAWWDPDDEQYVFTLTTRGLSAGVWQIVVRPDDGSEHVVSFDRR